MTFLELCKALARESGTLSNFDSQPASVTGQTGRNQKVVQWIVQAWANIQAQHRTWRFRQQEFTGTLLASTGEYTAASLAISNFGFWPNGESEHDAFTVYGSDGVSDETALHYMTWDAFKRRFRRGSQTDGRPQYWSISPAQELCVGPKPDGSYTITGSYIRSVQRLAANAEVPICPEDYHDGIVSYALEYLAEHDEGGEIALLPGRRRWSEYYRAMAGTELPRITRRGARMA